MSINLVSLVSQYLTPELVGRIATALGVDRTLVGKAVTALAPALCACWRVSPPHPQARRGSLAWSRSKIPAS